MEISFRVENGKVIAGNQQMRELFQSLDSGAYTLYIKKRNELITERDYQEAYFAMLDICVNETGNRRYVLHDLFKEHLGVESTKDFSIIRWQEALKKLKLWAFNEMNIIL